MRATWYRCHSLTPLPSGLPPLRRGGRFLRPQKPHSPHEAGWRRRFLDDWVLLRNQLSQYTGTLTSAKTFLSCGSSPSLGSESLLDSSGLRAIPPSPGSPLPVPGLPAQAESICAHVWAQLCRGLCFPPSWGTKLHMSLSRSPRQGRGHSVDDLWQ